MKLLAASIIGFLVVFLLAVVGTLFGAITGWLVGLVFEDSILGTLSALHIYGLTMWQLGAFLGFVGGFFRPVANVTTKATS